MAKALGFSPGQQDAWSKQLDGWAPIRVSAAHTDPPVPPAVVEIDIAHLDLDDPQVYDMLCAGDAVGVFQVESRPSSPPFPA